MNLPLQHIEALADFGYNEGEARFLYIVATYSGYFIQRQFLEFIGARRGKNLRRPRPIVGLLTS